MKPEQIEKIITEQSNKLHTDHELLVNVIQATEAYLLSHLETEGELDLIRIDQANNAYTDVGLATLQRKYPDGNFKKWDYRLLEVAERQRELCQDQIAPHLARVKELEGENERLKKEIESQYEDKRILYDEAKRQKDSVSQAVQAERDKFDTELVDLLHRIEDTGDYTEAIQALRLRLTTPDKR